MYLKVPMTRARLAALDKLCGIVEGPQELSDDEKLALSNKAAEMVDLGVRCVNAAIDATKPDLKRTGFLETTEDPAEVAEIAKAVGASLPSWVRNGLDLIRVASDAVYCDEGGPGAYHALDENDHCKRCDKDIGGPQDFLDDLLNDEIGLEEENPRDPCPRCSEPVTIGRCTSSGSRWYGGYEVVCGPCEVAFTGGDTEAHAEYKARHLKESM